MNYEGPHSIGGHTSLARVFLKTHIKGFRGERLCKWYEATITPDLVFSVVWSGCLETPCQLAPHRSTCHCRHFLSVLRSSINSIVHQNHVFITCSLFSWTTAELHAVRGTERVLLSLYRRHHRHPYKRRPQCPLLYLICRICVEFSLILGLWVERA